ncbi:hypothetical protein COCVIDRAFT_14742 [Bipolaris victoriae FI3]|uniref:Uncharacterized protein n=1 Tax=Bipolaris victoriae (strain FI3) TaxID=930091 RepID=W7EDD6_BIPV3|nr:hypothetical protein COCVIDRAFT_14742 [Bipolaris victoriae FI3]
MNVSTATQMFTRPKSQPTQAAWGREQRGLAEGARGRCTMTGSNVMGKASVVHSGRCVRSHGAAGSRRDSHSLASPLPCLLRLTWKRHQSASGRLEWRGGRFGLGWIQATAMLWAGFPTWACLSPGPDYSAITKHPKSKSSPAANLSHSPSTRLPLASRPLSRRMHQTIIGNRF